MDADDFWELVLDYWTVTIYLPGIILLVTVLVLITRFTDRAAAKRRTDGPAAHR